MPQQVRNVFEAIVKYGHDEDFETEILGEFDGTQAPAGSREKLEIMAARVAKGQPIWHDEDRPDYSGLIGVVRPRD